MNYTSLNDGDQVCPSLAIAQKIALSTPNALFCSFSVRGDESNAKKVPRKFNGEYWVDGVDSDTPIVNLITAKSITNYKDTPEPNGYLGLVLHNQIKDPFESNEYTLVCIDADTKRKPENEQYHIAIGALSKWARENNHLREIGYSGKGGFHVFIWAKVDQRIQKKYQLSTGQDIEVFGGIVGKKASVMLSGKKMAGDLQSDPVDLFELFEQLGVKQKVIEKNELIFPALPAPLNHLAPTITPKDWVSDYDKAKQALNFLDPDCDHDEWVAIGMALKDGLKDDGFQLWLQWSQKGHKFKSQQEIQQKFNSFKGNGIQINSLFAKAEENGWKNPNRGKHRLSNPRAEFNIVKKNEMGEFIDPDTGELIDEKTMGWEEQSYDLNDIQPIEYLIDGFIAHSFSVIAGQPGVGKTTSILSLAMAVAGINVPNSDAQCEKPRKIIYVSEDLEQVKRTLFAYTKLFPIEAQLIASRFVLIESKRADVTQVLKLAYNVQKHILDNETPWLIIDTANATLDIESENDNSEVGKFMAALKEIIYTKLKTSISIITHTNKLISKKDDDASARGASAFTGDATLTAVIFLDDEKNRYIRLTKHRYEPIHFEMQFETHIHSEPKVNRHGKLQDFRCIVTVPRVSSIELRQTKQNDLKEESKAINRKQILDKAALYVQDFINKNPNGVIMKRGSGGFNKVPDEFIGMAQITWKDIYENVKGSRNDPQIKSELKDYVFGQFLPRNDDGSSSWVRLVLP